MEKRCLRKRHNNSNDDSDLRKSQKCLSDFLVPKGEVKYEFKDEIKNISICGSVKKVDAIDSLTLDIEDQKDRKTTCSICKRDFLIEKQNIDVSTCDYCQQSISEKDDNDAKKKLRIVKTPKMFHCDICQKDVNNKMSFMKHQKMHKNKMNFKCNQCGQYFKFLIHLAKHQTLHNTNVDPSKSICPICNKAVTYISSHLRWHKEEPVECEICGAILKNKSTYISHKNNHKLLIRQGADRVIIPKALKIKKMAQCEICGLKILKHKLLTHIKIHVDPCLFTCWYCNERSYESMAELMEHVSQEHRKIRQPYIQCVSCMAFLNRDDYDIHMKSHSVLRFEYNGRTYKTERLLKFDLARRKRKELLATGNRRRIIKPNMKKVSCLICHQKVRICHMKSHITKHQHYNCPLCHKLSLSLDSYHAHKDTHARHGFRCPSCEKSFVSHVRFIAHSRKVHNVHSPISRRCPRCTIA